MPKINKMIFTGWLYNKPELRYTEDDVPITEFIVSAPGSHQDTKGVKQTDYMEIPVIARGELAQSITDTFSSVEFLNIGVLIEGRLKITRWEEGHDKKSSVAVISHSVQILGEFDEQLPF